MTIAQVQNVTASIHNGVVKYFLICKIEVLGQTQEVTFDAFNASYIYSSLGNLKMSNIQLFSTVGSKFILIDLLTTKSAIADTGSHFKKVEFNDEFVNQLTNAAKAIIAKTVGELK